jgi:hypothetical protein
VAGFRDHLRRPDDPRIAGIADETADSWAGRMLAHPRAGPLFAGWRRRLETEDFVGITTDGRPISALFDARRDEGAPARAMAGAARRVLETCTDGQRAALLRPLDARERRAWMNPEVYMLRFGLRLEEIDAPLRDAILAVVAASTSAAGFARIRQLMRLNGFLGELVNAPRVMNAWSYNFGLFGEVSDARPWGWNLFGHHLAMNCLVDGGRMVLTPAFMGAEPDRIDIGPEAGPAAFADEERAAMRLMRSLPDAQRRVARLFERKRDPAMPAGRVAVGDELMLAGAFQDNRVIPTEGLRASAMGEAQRDALLALVETHLAYLPDGPRAARMAEARARLADTWFCWIGGDDDTSPFYYRVQSPVLLIEFDHHAGVFLANPEPERFHVHTVVRTPNGGDYGMAWVAACRGCGVGSGGASP